MAVMAREAWTDERLDDLNARVEKGFDRVDADIRELRGEVKTGFDSVNSRIDSINSRIDSMQRTMIAGFVTLFGSIVASVIGGVFAVLTLG